MSEVDEPGTLYVMDADPEDLEPIEDGEMLSPHEMSPQVEEAVERAVAVVGNAGEELLSDAADGPGGGPGDA